MRDITALLHVYEFFFVSESGAGCRIDDFQKLKKVYAFGDLIAEIQKVFAFAKESQDRRELLLLPALAYTYLYAYLYFELNSLDAMYDAAFAYTKKFEKAMAPKWWNLLIGSPNPPENAVKSYTEYQKQVRILPEVRPILEFLIARCGNYDHYAKPIRDNIHRMDDPYSRLQTEVPAIIFELLDYMDSQVEMKRRTLWSK